MELIFVPLPLISQRPIAVVQLAEPVHGVVFPVPCVVASIFVVEGALAVALVVVDEPAVFAAVWVLLLLVLAEDLF